MPEYTEALQSINVCKKTRLLFIIVACVLPLIIFLVIFVLPASNLTVEDDVQVWLPLIVVDESNTPLPEELSPRPSVTPLTTTIVVTDALTFCDRYGGTVNGISYQQNAIYSYNNYQYITYFRRTTGDLEVAYRSLESDIWYPLIVETNALTSLNSHRAPVIGVSLSDGLIHLMYDSHASLLRYRRSSPINLIDPSESWADVTFTTVQNSLNSGGEPLDKFTYPRFVDGDYNQLYLFWRLGGAGDGREYMSVYSDGVWQDPQHLTDNLGLFVTDEFSSTIRSAYLNDVMYDPSSSQLHVTWTWREGYNLHPFNHDLGYAYSGDRGSIWKSNAGTIIGTQEEAISISSPDHIVASIGIGLGLINQEGMSIDRDGRVHVVVTYNAEGPPNLTNTYETFAEIRRNHAHVVHYWRDMFGQWYRNDVWVDGERLRATSRPKIVFDDYNNAYLIMLSGSDPVTFRIIGASEQSGWLDWQVLYEDEAITGEPVVDLSRTHSSNIVSVMQLSRFACVDGETGEVPGTDRLYVRDFQLALTATQKSGLLYCPGALAS